jgi:hypothetical protein
VNVKNCGILTKLLMKDGKGHCRFGNNLYELGNFAMTMA